MSVRVVAAPWVLAGRGGGGWADGAIALEGDVVRAAGPRAEVEARFGAAEPVDAVLLPALVNAHTHLELSHLQSLVPGGEGLADWVRMLLSARASHAEPGYAIRHAVLSLQEYGVAAVGDVSNTLASVAELSAAGLAGLVFHEVFGFAPARIEAALAHARALREDAPAPGPGLRVVTSPHAVYSTHLPVIAALLGAGPASIHLAEDPAERTFCAEAGGPFAALNRALGTTELHPLGRSAVAVAAPYLRPETLAVHAVDLDDDDVAALKASGATVVLCPRSNLHIGGRLPDLPRLLAAGVPLAIGTDSLASSPSLAPLAELAALARAFPRVAPWQLLPLAWNGPAVQAPAVGRLEPGSAPGVVAAPLQRKRPADPARWLLEAFGAEDHRLDWIARHRPLPEPAPARGPHA